MRLSIKAKLAALFGIAALVSVGQAALSVSDLSAIRADITELSEDRLPSVDIVNRIQTATRDNRVKLYRLVVASDAPEALAENKAALAEVDAQLAGLGRAYEPLIGSAEERGLYERYVAAWSRYHEEQAAIVADMEAGRQPEARRRLIAPGLLTIAKEGTGALQAGVELNKRGAEASSRHGLKSAEAAIRNACLAAAFAVLAALGAALFGLLAISRPIGRMTGAMGALAAGEGSVDVPGVGRRDEIGAMAGAVQVFKDNLLRTRALEEETALAREGAEAQRRAAMRDVADGFERTVGGIVGTVSSSASELQTTAQAMTAAAAETAGRSAAVATAAEEAAANVNAVSAAAEELGASVQEIGRQVSDSARLARSAVDEAGRTAAQVQALNGAVSRIGDVVTMITAIASQTNLLALNATIEAARAGEAGRGFAVVAVEVKELAAQTARATDEISQQIASIQGSTGDAVSAIGAITVRIEEIDAATAAIATAVEQQGAATQEIVRNVAHAADGTDAVTGNVVGVAQASEGTGAAAAQVLASATDLSQQSVRLGAEIARFLASVRAA